jgi:hypothetical protein
MIRDKMAVLYLESHKTSSLDGKPVCPPCSLSKAVLFSWHTIRQENIIGTKHVHYILTHTNNRMNQMNGILLTQVRGKNILCCMVSLNEGEFSMPYRF